MTTLAREKRTTLDPELVERNKLISAIMQRLDEKKSVHMFCMIKRALKTLGRLKVLAAVKAALDLEAQGGMLVKDGSRRRTPGGTFCFVLRSGCSWEEQRAIWPYRHVLRRQRRQREAAKQGRTV